MRPYPCTETATSTQLQPPYYLSLQMPNTDKPRFSLTSTYVPTGGTRVLTGFLAVDSDAGNQNGVRRAGYGKLRLLQLPRDSSVPGPGQVQNKFSEPAVSGVLNILRQNGSKVETGNLLTLPMGGGLLYVQPVYVQSTGETSYPLLQKVLVAFGDQIAFEDTLNKALDVLFGGSSGAQAGDTSVPTDGTTTPSTGGTTPSTSTGNPATDAQLQALLAVAKQAIADKQAALTAGDFAAYGVADKKLSDTIASMLALLGQ